MNTQYLQYFTVIAKLENMSKAAQILNVSQSSLSKALSSLESELGAELFKRSGKKLVLNEAGTRFAESCDLIINELETAKKDLALISAGYNDSIKICALEIGNKLSKCMAEFKKAYSKTEYVIDTFNDYEKLPDINDYDMIIYPDEIKYNKFRGSDFGFEKYYFAVNNNSSLSEYSGISDKLLNMQEFVFLRQGSHPEHSLSVCKTMGINIKSIHFVDSRQMQLQLIASGIGAGFVPESCGDIYRNHPSIKLLPLTDDRFKRPVKICFKRDKHLTENAAAFKNHVVFYFGL